MVQHAADVPATVGRLDRIGVEFNEKRLISDAGLLLTATLADRLGVQELVNESVWLPYGTPGAALPGRKVMTLVHGMIAGADSIDDMDLLRAGSTQAVLGHRVMAPSTLGTFLRAFSFGHVRQLDHVLDELIGRAWASGVGPGDGPLVIDMDSFVGEVYGYEKEGAGYGYTHKYGYHPLVATRSDTGEVLHIRLRKGSANTQRGVERFVDELLARVARAGHRGQIILRADIGFENHKLMRALHKRGVLFSIGAKQSAKVKALISEIPEESWVDVSDYTERGEAQVRGDEVIRQNHLGDWGTQFGMQQRRPRRAPSARTGLARSNSWTTDRCSARRGKAPLEVAQSAPVRLRHVNQQFCAGKYPFIDKEPFSGHARGVISPVLRPVFSTN
jgi:hypothetical protein